MPHKSANIPFVNPTTTGRWWPVFWGPFSALILLAGILNGLGLVIAFGLMGVASTAISLAWNRLSLYEVFYERRLLESRVFEGEETSITVSLTNKKAVPLAWVWVDDTMPDGLEVKRDDRAPYGGTGLTHLTSMAWFERRRWTHRLKARARGLYRIGPVEIESGDAFGFLRTRASAPNQDELLVYPRVYPLEELGITSASPLGDVKGGLEIFPDPARPSGIGDYRQGDPMKVVDWKATARFQRLQVRTFDPSSKYTVVLAVAVDTTVPYWRGHLPDELERVITAAASIAVYAGQRGYDLGMYVNDMPMRPGSPITVPPSTDPDHVGVVLGALATIRPFTSGAFAIGPMSEQLAEVARRFPYGSTVVCVTSLLPPELVSTIQELRRRGFKMVVVYVGGKDFADLPDGVIFHSIRDHLTFLEAEAQRVTA